MNKYLAVPFSELPVNQDFMYECVCFTKIVNNIKSPNAIRMANGYLYYFSDKEMVLPIDLKDLNVRK